jgi:6-phosphogluconolactonase
VRAALEISDDPAGAVAELLVGFGGRVAPNGGSTPRSAYEHAAGRRSDWSGVDVWLTDERCVPPDHEHSNFRMIEEALLGRIEGEPPTVHRMRGELGPDEGADAYERERRASFGEAAPVLDLVLVGLGPDVHVCSLFPGDAALGARDRLAVGVETPGMAPLVSRITLTLEVVNAAREVVFLVTGEGKAEAVARAFEGPPDPDAPGSLVRPEPGSLRAVLDPPAAALLREARC